MIYNDRIADSEIIDVSETNKSKQSDICHYWNFSGEDFKFQRCVCIGFHDLLIVSTNIDDTAIFKWHRLPFVLLAELAKVKPKPYCKMLI